MKAYIDGDQNSLETKAIKSKLKSKGWIVKQFKESSILNEDDLVIVRNGDQHLMNIASNHTGRTYLNYCMFWLEIEEMPTPPTLKQRFKSFIKKTDKTLFNAMNSPVKKGTYGIQNIEQANNTVNTALPHE